MRAWTIGLSLFAACTPSPPEGVLACRAEADCPEHWSCRRDLTCWRTSDADAGVEVFDAGGRDAGFDASRDAGCSIIEETYGVEADAVASRSERTQPFGGAREMNVSAGAMLIQFTTDVDLSNATRATLRLHGLVCSDGCDPGHRCDQGEFRVPGTLELYALSTRFDEASVTTESSRTDVPWAIDRGGATRGPLISTAIYSTTDARVDLVTDDVGAITGAASYAFLVDRPAGATNAFVARTIESGMPDAACMAGETPAAELHVERCVD